MLHKFQCQAISSELADIVGPAYVSTQASDRLIYTGDWSWMSQMLLDRGEQPPLPDFIVHPGSAAEVAGVMRVAASHGLPLVPWGGGSGTQGGAAPLYGGIVLDTKRLDRILEIDERSLTVRAQAGINGTQLEWALNERGPVRVGRVGMQASRVRVDRVLTQRGAQRRGDLAQSGAGDGCHR